MKLFYLMVSVVILATNPLFAMDKPEDICLSAGQIRQLVKDGEPHEDKKSSPGYYDVTINGTDYEILIEKLWETLIFGPKDKNQTRFATWEEYRESSNINDCTLFDAEQINFSYWVRFSDYRVLLPNAECNHQIRLRSLAYCNREKLIFQNHTKTYKVPVSYIQDLMRNGVKVKEDDKNSNYFVFLKNAAQEKQAWYLSLGNSPHVFFSDDSVNLVSCSLPAVCPQVMEKSFRLKRTEILSFKPVDKHFEEPILGLALFPMRAL